MKDSTVFTSSTFREARRFFWLWISDHLMENPMVFALVAYRKAGRPSWLPGGGLSDGGSDGPCPSCF